MAPTIVIIRRAVCFSGVSSAKCAQLPSLCGVWQSTQFKPREAEKNPIVSMNWLTGMPLSTWTLVKTSSAMRGFGWAGVWALAGNTLAANKTRSVHAPILRIRVSPSFIYTPIGRTAP